MPTSRSVTKRLSAEVKKGVARLPARPVALSTDPTDQVVEALLAVTDLSKLSDAVGYATYLRELVAPATLDVVEVRADEGAPDGVSRRLDALLVHTTTALGAVPVADALVLAGEYDRLTALRAPFDRDDFSADVGVHATRASTRPVPGRFLYAAARFTRARRVLEFGTGYGMSGLYFLASMAATGSPGTLHTVELSEPQFSTASEVLHRHHPADAMVHRGRSREVLPSIREAVGEVDLLFHDGGHSREAYVGDFAAVEPMLPSGSLVIFDDIQWVDQLRPGAEAQTYEGWREVSAHDRVRRAVEVQSKYGVLLLR